MELNVKIVKKLEESYGFFETDLDKQYLNKLVENLSSDNYDIKNQWSTYHQVVVELKYNVRDELRMKELQYHLTENEDPKHVCINFLMEIETITSELSRLYEKIKTF